MCFSRTLFLVPLIRQHLPNDLSAAAASQQEGESTRRLLLFQSSSLSPLGVHNSGSLLPMAAWQERNYQEWGEGCRRTWMGEDEKLVNHTE